MKLRFIIIFSFITMTLLTASSQKTGSMEGTVIGRSTYQPLQGVNVIVVGTHLGAASDDEGHFLIKNVPIGSYQIKASMIGYQGDIKTGIIVFTNRVTMLNFELNPTILELDEIVVTSGYFDKDYEKPVSTNTINSRDIRSSPGSGEDIYRIMQSMPGMTKASGRNANLIVRGGDPIENRTLLDNIDIVSPLHFAHLGTSMGVISIINPPLLKQVEFITGGFPAKFGDKMSAVFEMQLKEGNRTRFNFDCDLDMAGFSVLADGPVPGGGNMIFSARRGYFDLITSMMNRPVSPRYWDIVGKVTHPIGVNHKISIIGFYYKDDAERKETVSDADIELAKKYELGEMDIYGSAIGINWRYLFSKRGYMLTTAALISNGWKMLAGTLDKDDLNGNDLKENEFHLKNEFTYNIFDGIELKGGLFYKAIDSDHYTWRLADTTSTGFIIPAYTTSFYPELTFKAGSFLQTTLRPIVRLSINAGIRYDYFDFTDESKFSPRFGLSYYLTDKTTLNAAYGYYYQTPSAYQVALDPENTALRSSRAIHYIAGIERLLNHDAKLSVEVYHKDLDNTFVDSDTSSIITNAGSGYAQGIELFIQKKMSENFVGHLAYTYSISKRKDSSLLQEYNFEYDRPHNFTLVGGYKLSDKWQIGVKFQYASGSPYTPVVASVQKNGNWYIMEGTQNSARYPDFNQLDIRVDRRFNFSNWTLTAYFDILNIYNRDNVLMYTYNVDENGVITKEASYDFPLMPIVGLTAQF